MPPATDPDGLRAAATTPRSVVLPFAASELAGEFAVPGSKSLTNRALIAAAAADGGRVEAALDCDDTRLLASALEACGWPVSWAGDTIEIGRRRQAAGEVAVNLGNSGTGARLVLGLLAAVPGRFRVDGSARLRERPMAPLLDALRDLGSHVEGSDGHLPVTVAGDDLAGGRVTIRPEVSSQFVSALMLAGTRMRNGLEIEVAGPLPSAPYLDLTRHVLEAFGSEVQSSADRRWWRVAPGRPRPTTYRVEGDWSAAAFGLAAAAVAGGAVTVAGVSPDSAQGDRVVVQVLHDAGLAVETSHGTVTARGPRRRPFVADLVQSPDTFPALAAVAATGEPGSVLHGLGHLRHKESDRLGVMVDNLERLGARFRGTGASLEVVESIDLAPATQVEVTAADDHRIAMAMAVVGLVVDGLRLDDAGCVSKSFPGFWRSWRMLLGSTRLGLEADR